MANINLSLEFVHPDAVSHFVQYARIDNLNGSAPVYSTVVPNPTTSPAVIASNIPNGQYSILSTPVYADGRTCQATEFVTPACPGLIAINASITSNVMTVSYTAPSNVPKVRIMVEYPNGGSNVANYVNDGNDISISLPTNVFGDYVVTGQSVCDEVSGFYSSPSSSVVASIASETVRITSSAAGTSFNSITGISGFTQTQNVTPGVVLTGTHNAFTGAITMVFTGTPLFASNASLYINGNLSQCKDIPMTSGGTVVFNSGAYAVTDMIEIFFNTGTC